MAISAPPGNVCRVLNERNIYSIYPQDMTVSHWIFIDLEWYCIRIYECITLNFYWSGNRNGVYDHVRSGQQISQKICHFLLYFSRILDERNLVSSLAIQINQFKKASIKRRLECSPSNEQWQFFTQEQPWKMLYILFLFVQRLFFPTKSTIWFWCWIELTQSKCSFYRNQDKIVLILLKERAWGYRIEDTCNNIVCGMLKLEEHVGLC